jgi:hypothetical protein
MKTTLLLLSLVLTSTVYAASSCTYEMDQKSVKVSWTAFKTTQKVPVHGAFTEVNFVSALKKQNSLAALLNGARAEIHLKNAGSSSTGNPARDQTLFDHFFGKFAGGTSITGKVSDVTGTNEAGDLKLAIHLNGKTVKVPVHFTEGKDGAFEAKGTIDVLDFALNGALADLHKNCEAVHKGPDGISKTWSTVDIQFNATVNQKCEP